MHSPTYHPQSNGQAEIAVQDVKTLLKHTLQENSLANWKQLISDIQKDPSFAQTPLLSGQSPTELLFSFTPNTTFSS